LTVLASLINSFKFALTYYLDSVGTSNEGLNTMANIGITTTSRAVDRRKRRMSEYPLIIETSFDCINTYQLPSLGYNITDRHLPRGFVTSRKSDTSVLCDFVYCDQRSDVSWHAGMVIIVIACNVVNSNALYAWNTFRVRLRKTSMH